VSATFAVYAIQSIEIKQPDKATTYLHDQNNQGVK